MTPALGVPSVLWLSIQAMRSLIFVKDGEQPDPLLTGTLTPAGHQMGSPVAITSAASWLAGGSGFPEASSATTSVFAGIPAIESVEGTSVGDAVGEGEAGVAVDVSAGSVVGEGVSVSVAVTAVAESVVGAVRVAVAVSVESDGSGV